MPRPPRKTHRTIAPAVAAALTFAAADAASAQTSPRGAGNARCEAAAIAAAERLGIGRGDIGNIDVIANTAGSESRFVFEYLAWISPKSCAGTLVIKLTRSCRVTDSYARGACTFPGVPAN